MSVYTKLGKLQTALADVNQALQLKPAFVYAYANRGQIRVALGDLQGAIADCTQAIQLSPNLPELYWNRGQVYVIARDRQAALVDFQTAAQLSARQGKQKTLSTSAPCHATTSANKALINRLFSIEGEIRYQAAPMW